MTVRCGAIGSDYRDGGEAGFGVGVAELGMVVGSVDPSFIWWIRKFIGITLECFALEAVGPVFGFQRRLGKTLE